MTKPRTKSSLTHERVATWCAPAFSVLALVGFVGIAHFYDPARAGLSAAATAAWFHAHHETVLVGMTLFLVAVAFLAVWSAQLSLMIWRIAEGSPLLAVCQAIGGAVIVMVVLLDSTLWIGADFRTSLDGHVVQAFNDSAWFSFMMAWPVFAVQMLATATAGLGDRRSTPMFPRVLEYGSIVCAICGMTSLGIGFTTHGAFSYHGVLGYYFGMGIWLVWINSHAWCAHRAISEEIKGLQTAELSPGETQPHRRSTSPPVPTLAG